MREDKRKLVCLGVLFLLVVFSVCLTSVLIDAFDDVVKTEVSRHDNGGPSFPVGINLNERNRKKREIVTATILAAVSVAISFIDLVVTNVRKSSENSDGDAGDAKNPREIVAHFEQIQMELEQQKEELRSINQEIKKLGLSIIYFEHEDKIKYSLLTLIEYLGHPNDHNRNVFIEKASHLGQSIRVLVDGLLGQHTFSHDIMVIMRDAAKCHGRTFRKNVKSIVSLIMAGLHVRDQYQRILNSTEGSSPFKKYIGTSLPKLKTKFDDMAIECQADETNVSDEMRKIMEVTLTPNRQNLTNALLYFLEEKYDTKWWLVIIQNEGLEYSVWSSGFHHVSVRNNVAFAISVDRRTERIPIGTSFNFGFSLSNLLWLALVKPKGWSSSVKIEKYVNRLLIPVRAKSEVETKTFVFADKMAWQNSYAMSTNLTIYFENITHSLPPKWNQVVGIIVILRRPAITLNPSSPSPSRLRNQIECSYDPDRAAQEYGPLRNERTQSYLSVQGDSSKEGASIILDRQWRNSSGQKWKFVDGQLRNGFGKCLTFVHDARPLIIGYVYQYNCVPKRPTQKWDRHGLFIMSDIIHHSSLILVFNGELHQDPMFVNVVFHFDFSSSSYWYNRDTNCEDAMVIQSTTNGSRPLRNEFSRFFLDVEDDYGTEQPWSNHPSQLWKFVDGSLLKNDEGKCLEGSGWYVLSVDCNAKVGQVRPFRWTYTENRQIKSEDGYCLSSAGEKDYVYYDYCRDEPRQRWWYF